MPGVDIEVWAGPYPLVLRSPSSGRETTTVTTDLWDMPIEDLAAYLGANFNSLGPGYREVATTMLQAKVALRISEVQARGTDDLVKVTAALVRQTRNLAYGSFLLVVLSALSIWVNR
jgi:hypothetical protein